MKTTNNVGHSGIVERISSGSAYVSFQHTSGCSGCSINSSCGMSESTEKVFRIPLADNKIKEGDHVMINISMRNGYKAVVWGYLFPFLLVLATLTITLISGLTEAVAGIASLGVLIPYYVMLKGYRALFKNDLSIEVQKQ